MPHWIQFNLPEEIELDRVEVVNRPGGYNVCDFDVQVPDGKAWRIVKSVRNAKAPTILAPLDQPVRAAKVRVTVLRESIGGKNRIIADVQTVRVIDAAGVNRAVHGPPRYPLAVKDTGLAKALGEGGIAVEPAAVAVEPKGAEVLATIGIPGAPPAILRRRHGEGQAILITAHDGAFSPASPLWPALARLLAGRPTVACSDPARYRVILARAAGGHVLHVIDRRAGAPGHKPAEVTLSLLAARLGGLTKITLPPGAPPPKTADGLTTLTLRPDPVVSIQMK